MHYYVRKNLCGDNYHLAAYGRKLSPKYSNIQVWYVIVIEVKTTQNWINSPENLQLIKQKSRKSIEK